ncbi:phage tail protein [Paenibacillus spiritus]|uniref:Phage tail protein n=1 Tax=Paenibacillus spiritus TaxID=2496557 RepID=A0A5J5G856_9BACL|nr:MULTISPECIES: tail protein X [Paenibacillus]KAA9003990.1 phage tail protein [Paenibacillus spiritus]
MTQYRTIQGDTWDAVAYKLYGDENLMTLLLEANPEQADKVILDGNLLLHVPVRPEQTSEDLPPWKREG